MRFCGAAEGENPGCRSRELLSARCDIWYLGMRVILLRHLAYARGLVKTSAFSVLVEGAVMAPDIAKVDADRHPNLGLPVWNFSDEVLRWLLHGNSLSPFRKTCSSHFPLTMGNRQDLSSIYKIFGPVLTSQLRISRATNSGRLSERRCSGTLSGIRTSTSAKNNLVLDHYVPHSPVQRGGLCATQDALQS